MPMNSKTLVSEGAIKEVLSELFAGSSQGSFDPGANRMKNLSMYTVDPWVLMYQTTPATDPNMAQDAPLNPDIVPQNKRELEISLKELMKDLDDVEVPKLFKQIKSIVDDILEEEGDEDMKDKVHEVIRTEVKKLIKEAKQEPKELSEVRKMIRKVIQEAGFSPSSTGLGTAIDYWSDRDDDSPRAPTGKKARTVADVGGVPWEQLKKVSGHAGRGTSGIEQYVYGKPTEPGGAPVGGLVQRFANIVSATAPDIQDYIDDETKGKKTGQPGKGQLQMARGVIVRKLVDEYIDYLASSGVLDPEDIEFLHDNPDAIETQELFQDMLQKTVDQLEAQKQPSEEAKFVMKDLRTYLKDLRRKFGG